ncbi:MAG: biotin-dependent carboxyltransferase, partial [Chitinophagaceae bacterium]
MSLTVIKPGVLDLVQDTGRYGWQHLGINPGGAMDRWSAQVANILVGNESNNGVLELHFPAGEFLFESPALITICGADFSPHINGEPVSCWQPVFVRQNSVLQFKGWKSGARCYLAIEGGLLLERWLHSYSTNLKCGAGGYQGRALQKGDHIPYRSFDSNLSSFTPDKDFIVLPWKADRQWNKEEGDEILVMPGQEWDRLQDESKTALQAQEFIITQQSDRMGYRLDALMQANST